MEKNKNVRRTACPYYGFYMGPGILLDQEGNECALLINSYSPCMREMNKQKPDWELCSFNNLKNKSIIEDIVNNFRVFPKEFKPKCMPFKQWSEYIKNQQSLSPES